MERVEAHFSVPISASCPLSSPPFRRRDEALRQIALLLAAAVSLLVEPLGQKLLLVLVDELGNGRGRFHGILTNE
jgi:hypothetical protein